MARKLTTIMYRLQCDCGTGDIQYQISALGRIGDTVDPTMGYDPTGTQIVSPPPRMLTAGEKLMTVQAFFDQERDRHKTAQGIV